MTPDNDLRVWVKLYWCPWMPELSEARTQLNTPLPSTCCYNCHNHPSMPKYIWEVSRTMGGVDFMQGRKTNDNAIMTTQHLTTTRNDSPLKGLSLIQGMPYCMEKGLSLLLCLAVKRGQHSPFIFYHAISSFCTCHYPSINCFYISAFCLVQSWQIMLAYSSWWCIQWYSVNKVIIDKFRKKNSAILKLCLREFSLNMMILSGVTYFVH